jgi:hypothetical protein
MSGRHHGWMTMNGKLMTGIGTYDISVLPA